MGRTFQLHARSHKVLAHIITPGTGKEKSLMTDEEKKLWSTLDATVLQQIYATISTDIFLIVIEPDSKAMAAWDRLRDIFQDNQNSCVVFLEHDFAHVKIRDYPNATSYCQRLKSLSGKLKSVEAPTSKSRRVLQLVSGLTQAYNYVGTQIRQRKPLPSFTEARSSLRLEEKALAEMLDDSPSAMVAASPREYDDSSSYGDNPGHNCSQNKKSTAVEVVAQAQAVATPDGGGGRGSGNNQPTAPA